MYLDKLIGVTTERNDAQHMTKGLAFTLDELGNSLLAQNGISKTAIGLNDELFYVLKKLSADTRVYGSFVVSGNDPKNSILAREDYDKMVFGRGRTV